MKNYFLFLVAFLFSEGITAQDRDRDRDRYTWNLYIFKQC